MKTRERNTTTLDQFKDKHYGPRGTEKRENLESGYENFKIEAMIDEVQNHERRNDAMTSRRTE